MYFSDNHVHTSYSYDCTTPMETIINSALAKGLKEIVFTDHVDFNPPDNLDAEMIDFDKYLVNLDILKAKYRKEINILLGVEIGAEPGRQNEINNLLNKYPFEFVICSTHTMNGVFCSDNSFFGGKTQKVAYRGYLEGLLSNVSACTNYDVCGHLDFISRYSPYAVKKMNYHDYADMIDTILKTIIETGHGIELNTSGYRYGLKQTHPSLDVVKRYRELGGEIITVGSDAHKADDVCAHFNLAYEILKTAGFSYLTQFRQREPYFLKLDGFQENLPITA